jgi:hypothetical protein
MVWFDGLMQIKKTLSGRRNGSKSLVGELQIAAVVLDSDGAREGGDCSGQRSALDHVMRGLFRFAEALQPIGWYRGDEMMTLGKMREKCARSLIWSRKQLPD